VSIFLFSGRISSDNPHRVKAAGKQRYKPPKNLLEVGRTTGGNGKVMARLAFFEEESVSQAQLSSYKLLTDFLYSYYFVH
jgi:hypothetical protein